MPVLAAPEFSLRECLSSGQTFRWRFHNGWYEGIAGASVLKVRQEGDALQYESSDPAVAPNRIAHYFGLTDDLPAILRSIDVDAQIHDAIGRHRGLRVLHQDGWETLASFICASFNNIRRIEGMIERLCQAYGRPVALTPPPTAAAEGGSVHRTGPFGPAAGGGVNGLRGFAFPVPEAIAAASQRSLRALGLGYRAPYLKATARLVAEGRLPIEQLQQVEYARVRAALLGCDGVGEKIADCVALFGFEKHEAFPVDVWMARAMRYYFRRRKMTPKRVQAFAHAHFGAYAGYAQQYLYQYVRHLPRTPSG